MASQEEWPLPKVTTKRKQELDYLTMLELELHTENKTLSTSKVIYMLHIAL